MTKVSKAEFARNLNVSGARVSQYVARGLPILENGKIDLEAGTRWVAENVRQKIENEGKGAARATQNLKQKPSSLNGKAVAALNPPPALHPIADILKPIILEAGWIAARMAIEAGASMKVAVALDRMVAIEVSKVADGFISDAEASQLHRDWPFDGRPDCAAESAKWTALAAKAGETFDEEACDAFLASLSWAEPAQ